MANYEHTNSNQKRAGVARLTSDTIHPNAKENVIRDKEVCFIVLKGPAHQKDIMIIHIYPLTNEVSKYTKDGGN